VNRAYTKSINNSTPSPLLTDPHLQPRNLTPVIIVFDTRGEGTRCSSILKVWNKVPYRFPNPLPILIRARCKNIKVPKSEAEQGRGVTRECMPSKQRRDIRIKVRLFTPPAQPNRPSHELTDSMILTSYNLRLHQAQHQSSTKAVPSTVCVISQQPQRLYPK
jgi:hypothetical protein